MTYAPAPVRRRHALRSPGLAWLAALVVLAAVIVLLLESDFFGSSSSTSGVQGSGVAAAESRALPAFSSVELAGSNELDITVGGRQSVVVHADDNLLDRVTTRVENGRLLVGNSSGSFSAKTPMRVVVSVPSLTALALSGSGIVTATGVDERALTLDLLGSGVLRVTGTVDRLDVTLAGSGDAQLDGLAASDVRAVVAGSGRILVHPTRSLDASVPGTGSIVYTGDPAHVTTNVSGVGAVVHG